MFLENQYQSKFVPAVPIRVITLRSAHGSAKNVHKNQLAPKYEHWSIDFQSQIGAVKGKLKMPRIVVGRMVKTPRMVPN